MNAKHTPGPWTFDDNHDGSISIRQSDNVLVAELNDAETADLNLITAAPDLLSDARDTVALLRRCLEMALKYIPDSDKSGHPHGYSVVQIPDWEVRQKIEWLEQSIAKAEGRS